MSEHSVCSLTAQLSWVQFSGITWCSLQTQITPQYINRTGTSAHFQVKHYSRTDYIRWATNVSHICNFKFPNSYILKNNFVLDFIYLIFRERGREGEGKQVKHQCVRETSIDCFSHIPNWGPGLQPRQMPWPGIKLVTPWFAGQQTHWARQPECSLKNKKKREINISYMFYLTQIIQYINV